jgi:hypothetical protein
VATAAPPQMFSSFRGLQGVPRRWRLVCIVFGWHLHVMGALCPGPCVSMCVAMYNGCRTERIPSVGVPRWGTYLDVGFGCLISKSRTMTEPDLVPSTRRLSSMATATAQPLDTPSISDRIVLNPSLRARCAAAMASRTRAAGPTARKRTGASSLVTCEWTCYPYNPPDTHAHSGEAGALVEPESGERKGQRSAEIIWMMDGSVHTCNSSPPLLRARAPNGPSSLAASSRGCVPRRAAVVTEGAAAAAGAQKCASTPSPGATLTRMEPCATSPATGARCWLNSA